MEKSIKSFDINALTIDIAKYLNEYSILLKNNSIVLDSFEFAGDHNNLIFYKHSKINDFLTIDIKMKFEISISDFGFQVKWYNYNYYGGGSMGAWFVSYFMEANIESVVKQIIKVLSDI